MAAKRDFYEVMGVERAASAGDIRKSYLKLVRRHHPDLNPGNPTAEEKFKELGEAYDVLADEQKRAAYDNYGHAAFDLTQPPDSRGRTSAAPDPFAGFRDFFNGGGSGDTFNDNFFGTAARETTAPTPKSHDELLQENLRNMNETRGGERFTSTAEAAHSWLLGVMAKQPDLIDRCLGQMNAAALIVEPNCEFIKFLRTERPAAYRAKVLPQYLRNMDDTNSSRGNFTPTATTAHSWLLHFMPQEPGLAAQCLQAISAQKLAKNANDTFVSHLRQGLPAAYRAKMIPHYLGNASDTYSTRGDFTPEATAAHSWLLHFMPQEPDLAAQCLQAISAQKLADNANDTFAGHLRQELPAAYRAKMIPRYLGNIDDIYGSGGFTPAATNAHSQLLSFAKTSPAVAAEIRGQISEGKARKVPVFIGNLEALMRPMANHLANGGGGASGQLVEASPTRPAPPGGDFDTYLASLERR